MSSGRNTPRNPEGTDSTVSLSEELAATDKNAFHERASENDKAENKTGQEKEERRQRQAKRKHESGQRKGEQRAVSGKEELELGQGKEGDRQGAEKWRWRLLKREGSTAKERLKEQGEVYCPLSQREAELGKGVMERLGIIKRRGKKVTIVDSEEEAAARMKLEERYATLSQKDLKVRSGKGEAKVGQELNVVASVKGEGKVEVGRGKREGRAGVPKERAVTHKGQEQVVGKPKKGQDERQVDAVVKQALKGEGLVHGATQTDFEEGTTQARTKHGDKEVEAFIEERKSIQSVRKGDTEGRRRMRRFLNRLWERAAHRPHSTDDATMEILREDIVAMVWARWRTMNVLQI